MNWKRLLCLCLALALALTLGMGAASAQELKKLTVSEPGAPDRLSAALCGHP